MAPCDGTCMITKTCNGASAAFASKDCICRVALSLQAVIRPDTTTHALYSLHSYISSQICYVDACTAWHLPAIGGWFLVTGGAF